MRIVNEGFKEATKRQMLSEGVHRAPCTRHLPLATCHPYRVLVLVFAAIHIHIFVHVRIYFISDLFAAAGTAGTEHPIRSSSLGSVEHRLRYCAAARRLISYFGRAARVVASRAFASKARAGRWVRGRGRGRRWW